MNQSVSPNSNISSCFLELLIEISYFASLLFFYNNQYACGILLTFSFIYVLKQMELFYKIVVGEENYIISVVKCREGSTFAKIHDEIMDDEIIGYPFDFIQDGTGLNPKQEKKCKVCTTLVGIKRKLGTFDVEEECSNVVKTIPIFENIEVNVDGPMHKQPRVENMSLSMVRSVSISPHSPLPQLL